MATDVQECQHWRTPSCRVQGSSCLLQGSLSRKGIPRTAQVGAATTQVQVWSAL